jgi:hypothetical protein
MRQYAHDSDCICQAHHTLRYTIPSIHNPPSTPVSTDTCTEKIGTACKGKGCVPDQHMTSHPTWSHIMMISGHATHHATYHTCSLVTGPSHTCSFVTQPGHSPPWSHLWYPLLEWAACWHPECEGGHGYLQLLIFRKFLASGSTGYLSLDHQITSASAMQHVLTQ